ncbi:hypothetical protein CHH28_06310 [Bacterioplanes sanyensis]|uniref:Uncharacterized protein n=1 Tax=Bacterioplanes sanyensis TaxID=1249553 RepID=A0A222FGY1_9GAMM|nr:hypothetical protein [Bacterioplanes sanyensis]ASP38315.1 hypothetical protein CHH28_06310 [Bacterioplanes sanyensis]
MSIMQRFPNYFADCWYGESRSPEQLDAELVSERLTALNSADDELALLNSVSLEEQMQHINLYLHYMLKAESPTLILQQLAPTVYELYKLNIQRFNPNKDAVAEYLTRHLNDIAAGLNEINREFVSYHRRQAGK